MAGNELEEMLNKSHRDLSVEDFEGKKVPCIGFEGRKFDDILTCLLYTSDAADE